MTKTPRQFDDRQISRLLRMAVEAHELEHGPEAPAPLHIHAAPRQASASGRRRSWIPMATSIAAVLALAGVVAVFMKPAPTAAISGARTGSPIAAVPVRASNPASIARVNHAPALDEQTVLLAIYHDPIVGTRCVSWRDYDFDHNKCLGDVSDGELQKLCLHNTGLDSCPSIGQVTLVALAGPRDSLPATDNSARELADCILQGDRGCDSAGACYMPAARSCVPKNVSVKIQTVAGNG